MIRKVIDYIKEDSFELRASNHTISIVNYVEISYMEETQISVRYQEGTIFIKGKDLTVVKLLDQELLIKGEFSTIEFRRSYE